MTGFGERFPKALRIRTKDEFRAVFESGLRCASGPLVVHARANDLGHHRLGLAVPRRVGSAVRRNRIKRRLREAFRRHRAELPGAYDLVVNVRPHTPLSGAEYTAFLLDAARRLDTRWRKRRDRQRDE